MPAAVAATRANESDLQRYEASLQQITDEERGILGEQQVALLRHRELSRQQASLDADGAGAEQRMAVQRDVDAATTVLTSYQLSLRVLQERRSRLNAEIQALHHRAALVRHDLRQRTQNLERERREIESVEMQVTSRRQGLTHMEREQAELQSRLNQLIGSIE